QGIQTRSSQAGANTSGARLRASDLPSGKTLHDALRLQLEEVIASTFGLDQVQTHFDPYAADAPASAGLGADPIPLGAHGFARFAPIALVDKILAGAGEAALAATPALDRMKAAMTAAVGPEAIEALAGPPGPAMAIAAAIPGSEPGRRAVA